MNSDRRSDGAHLRSATAEDAPLAGLRVVEFGDDPAMAVAGGRLGFLGAEVVVVQARNASSDAHLPGASALRPEWRAWNGGKAIVRAGTVEEFRDIVHSGDVLLAGTETIENRDLRSVAANGAMTIESDWEGLNGELSVQALSGMLSYLGELEADPVRIGWEAVTWAQGVLAAQAVIAACVSGAKLQGGHVRIPVLRTAATLISNQIVAHSAPDEWIGFAAYQWQPREHGFGCADGWLEIIFFRDDEAWRRFCEAIGAPALADDSRFATYPSRTNHKAELVAALQPVLTTLPAVDVAKLVEECGGMVGQRLTIHEATRQPQIEANGLLYDGETPTLTSPWLVCGSRTFVPESRPGPDWSSSRSPWRGDGDVCAEGRRQAPLAGITVADVTEGAQGPFAVSLLADLGAGVIKLERPGGEFMRHVGPYKEGEALPFLALSHGRRLCSEVDLRTAEGRTLARRTAAACDVFVENWRPGTAARLSLAPADLHDENHDLVYVSASGFGAMGPMAEKGALDQISQAVSGLWSLSGSESHGPERFRGALLDYLSALVTTEGALIGLVKRARGTRDITVEVSQLASALSAGHSELLAAAFQPTPRGSRSRHYCPSAAFQTSDGEWIVVEVTEDRQWKSLLAELDSPGLAGPAYATNEMRMALSDDVHAAIEKAVRQRTLSYWIASDRGFRFSPLIRPLEKALGEDGVLVTQRHVLREPSRVGEVLRVRPPWDMPGCRQVAESGPTRGRDTAFVESMLGYSQTGVPTDTSKATGGDTE